MLANEGTSTKVDWSRFAPARIDKTSVQWAKLDDLLHEGHVARQIDRGVDALDFGPLKKSYKYSGSPPSRPDLMLKMLLFCYRRGLTSPARFFCEAKENHVMQWLGQGLTPSRSVCYQFVARIGPFLDPWNREVLVEAERHGLLSDDGASLDGTTVAALASRHRLLTLSQVEKRVELLEVSPVAISIVASTKH